eukprot:CAMPEP_0170489744 /NCGR_PEP_ID=MMETSP0208-20121228/8046_1 /TAXON_ID=197538 /ORGANISM="Strombidium inclinatum, Strain S3" /LENGTH=266 /DNA_ID=CAMNT_0010764805 /DNA_START=2091 /DNA_END=2891 /DNA_ORIENTATION=+
MDRFDQNEEFLRSGHPDDMLPFPENYQSRYPHQLREIFEYLQAVMRKRELLLFLEGKLYSEKIINMYFKILEKMNLVQLSMDNYQKQIQLQNSGRMDGSIRNSISSSILMGLNTMKIQYMTTHLVRKLKISAEHETPLSDRAEQSLQQYFNHDLILLPFFFDEVDDKGEGIADPETGLVTDNHNHMPEVNENTGEVETLCGCTKEKRTVLVSVKVLDNQVDLFDKDYRDNDNHDISNCVLNVMDDASRLQNIALNEELIDADITNI